MRIHQACGTPNDDDAIFCIGCGAKLDDEGPSFGYTPNVAEIPMDQPWGQPDSAQVYDSPWNQPDASVTNQWEQQMPPVQDAQTGSTWDAPAPAQPMPMVDPQVLERLDALDAQLAEFANVQRDLGASMGAASELLSTVEQQIGNLSSQFESKIARNEHEVATMKRMSDEVQQYRDDLYAKLTLPLIRDMIEARDALGSICQRYAHDPDKADVISEINVCRSMLADRLGRQSVEVVTSSEGDEFLSFRHKIVGKVHTSDPSLQGRIAEVSGDSYRLGDQYLSPAMVKVYALD